eukprot:scaffold21113_cov56-Isochrysis_galbana.AAC.1
MSFPRWKQLTHRLTGPGDETSADGTPGADEAPGDETPSGDETRGDGAAGKRVEAKRRRPIWMGGARVGRRSAMPLCVRIAHARDGDA